MESLIVAANAISWPGAFTVVGICACIAYAVTY